MAHVDASDRRDLDQLIRECLRERIEESPDVLVEALVNVSLGFLIESLGHLPPVSREFELRQMAPFIVGGYLQGTRPSPNNAYLGLLRNVANSYLRQKHPRPPVEDEVVVVLATLAMGLTREIDPKPTRAAMTVKLVDLYVAGRGAPS